MPKLLFIVSAIGLGLIIVLLIHHYVWYKHITDLFDRTLHTYYSTHVRPRIYTIIQQRGRQPYSDKFREEIYKVITEETSAFYNTLHRFTRLYLRTIYSKPHITALIFDTFYNLSKQTIYEYSETDIL